ncbi:hypothetical protein sscle_07g055510 [Sclerotinia sclerotiorum 1980 UF-70]|uniref:Uncharacterized protein n=1 Tax=Sclerotinia sclerotiorum (strain ATCC 18683 / 1980 / Ss-1) TaxID=665079 RepID=A0A1D9Q775_SCLS1|nr:hypothetical protein sscle_07g055510 [Sclerotinia sclerotiorum 1980 UF-70]
MGESSTKIEPLAIVGLSFKFPQGMETANSLWKGLASSRSAWSSFPESRLNFDGVYDPDTGRLNSFPLKGAHFLNGDISAFDAPFFTIGPSEAAEIDPQSRILLEVTYRALENAGISIESVSNTNTSVYTGSFGDDYKSFSTKDPQFGGQYSASSVSANMLANRISWYFNLRGESINMDTACSSTLVAFHTACERLRSRESNMAIVAGSNLFLSPDMAMSLNNQNFLSPDGRCWSFDEKANGYGRGEGFGVLVVKRLSDALENNDPIRAAVLATGTNQDGRTPGIVQPSRSAQAQLIRDVYRKAGLDMSQTRYVEAHGTGTSVGDPIEAGAIADAFSHTLSADSPLFIGSIKSNIGHLEGTSGIAGLVKSVLILERRMIPGIAGLEHVNHSIVAEHPHLKFPKDLTSWPSDSLCRLSINSFGFGGTNAHVIMEDAAGYLDNREKAINRTQVNGTNHANHDQRPMTNGFHHLETRRILVFSAQDENGIKRLESAYNDHWSQMNKDELSDSYMSRLSYTLGNRRSALLWRSFATVNSKNDLITGIKFSRAVRALPRARLAFCFTGQGAQWYAMGRDIQAPIFKQSLRELSELLTDMGCLWSLQAELSRDKETSRINRPEFSQPICTAIQIALIDLLEGLDIKPSVAFGHSSGEIATAYCVGALDKRSAMSVAYYRGLLSSKVAEDKMIQGGMLSAGLSAKEVLPYLARVEAKFGYSGVVVGCINSPNNVTITGDIEQINYLNELLEKESIFSRKLLVDVAYHSHHMNAIAAAYSEKLGNLSSRNSAKLIPMVSSVTGEVVSSDKLRQPGYWVENMVSPVRFLDAISCAPSLRVSEDGSISYNDSKDFFDDVLEIGPHSALQGPIKDFLKLYGKTSAVGYYSILIRNVNSNSSMFEAFGNLYCRGHRMSIQALNEQSSSGPRIFTPLTDLPEYPFDHSRSYWRESRLSRGHRFRKIPRNDFLGTPVPDWNPQEAKWRRRIKLSEDPWIEDHKIANACILPASAMLVMAIEAAKIMAKLRSNKAISGFIVQNVVVSRALTIPSDPDGTEIEFYLRPCGLASDREITWSNFRIYIPENDNWVEVCRGQVRATHFEVGDEVDNGLEDSLSDEYHRAELWRIRGSSCQKVDMERFYPTLRENGIDFGTAHQTIKNGSYGQNMECVGDIALDSWVSKKREFQQMDFTIHPTSLDGLFQLGLLALVGETSKINPSVIVGLRKLWVSEGKINVAGSSIMPTYAKSAMNGATGTLINTVAFENQALNPVIILDGLEGKFLEQTKKSTEKQNYHLSWNFDYRPDIELLSKEELIQYVSTSYDTQPAPFQLDHDVKLLLYLCILRTLDRLTDSEIAELKPHHHKFFEWMQYERNKLNNSKMRNSAVNVKEYLNDDMFYEKLLSRLEHSNARGKLYAVLSKNLRNILMGKVDALELMFKEPLVKDYYRELYKSTNGLSKTLAYLDILTHKHPNMNILEIGAGTGGMTNYLLDVLAQNGARDPRVGTPRFSHYTYTDISAGFFEGAAPLFQNFSDMVTFKVLDIEKDPAHQGFEAGGYDCIIADNVLHATRDLDVTIKNVRKLLKPGGKLMLFELTVPEVVRTNFAFGLLPGWWRFNDKYRSFSAGISDSVWDRVLKSSGFSGIDFNFKDYEEDECHEHSALVSTARGDTLSISPFLLTVVVLDPQSDLQRKIYELLRHTLQSAGTENILSMTLKEAATFHGNSAFGIVLLELDRPLLQEMTEPNFKDVKAMFLAFENILWACKGGGERPDLPEYALVQGAFRALRMENIRLKFISLSFEATSTNPTHLANKVFEVYQKVSTTAVKDCEQEYVERNGMICIDRIIDADYMNQKLSETAEDKPRSDCEFCSAPPVALSIKTPGLLDTLEFVEDSAARTNLASDEIEIEVEASGVNFRDCLIALGRIPSMSFGFECSGTIHRIGSHATKLKLGDRVCASTLGTYQTYARCNASNVIPIPSYMSFIDAAALPVVFTTAYYAIVHVAQLRKGESILIHSAAGGTGQAAIQIAKLLGAEIFVTVGSKSKKDLLISLYQIPEDHIFYSRNAFFVKGIQRMTGDHGGVDVVLNSLSGDLLVDTWQCIAPFGRFLEIGKKDILANGNLPMLPFSRNASFHAIDLNEARKYRPGLLLDLKNSITTLLFDDKIRPPQPVHVYGISEVEKAFRYLQSGKNSGKTVIEFRGPDIIKASLKRTFSWTFPENATYVIAGGLGGIGRSTAQWMADRGAKNLVLLSRSGPTSEEASQCISSLQAQGVRVETPLCDISDFKSLESVLKSLDKKMPPIKGCIQSAMVLRSSVFENMTYEDWVGANKCKVSGTWNLHTLLPKGLDHFIVYSSISGAIGGTASVNYSAACAYQDALVHYRNKVGEKATTFNLGVMVDDGVLRDNTAVRTALLGTGYLVGIKQEEMFALLEHHCDPSLDVPKTPLRSQIIVGIDTPSSIKARRAEVPAMMTRPMFRGTWSINEQGKTGAKEDVATDVTSQLHGVASETEAANIIANALMQRLSNALAVPMKNLDSSRPMHIYGVDSLIAVELRNWFNQKLDADIAVFEILGEVTFRDIGFLVAGKSKLVEAILKKVVK